MKQRFYSNGKLLLTGEYVVLDGAKALAFPTKPGQDLKVSPSENHQIKWSSFDNNGSPWFETIYKFEEICNPNYVEKNDNVRNTLLEILHEAWLKNPKFLENALGYEITTNLDFPKNWGLGTSSTLINNIAQWLKIDAFQLLNDSFGGSGYDIACAQNDTPLVYQLNDGNPVVENVVFAPDYCENLYFVYLNKKQSSKSAIASYYANRTNHPTKIISEIDRITERILIANDVSEFAYLLEKHESIMSGILEMQTIKESRFSDFTGVVKSLGGWGGDFALAVSKSNPKDYFESKGYATVVPFKEMIL